MCLRPAGAFQLSRGAGARRQQRRPRSGRRQPIASAVSAQLLANALPESPLEIKWLGRVPYEPTWRAMQQFTNARDEHTRDQLWLLEHERKMRGPTPDHLFTTN